ncbi:hypothetical protein Tco_0481222 [Tanacetum coccineum]
MHRDYLKVTKEHVATLKELLEEARALKPLDEHIGHASKFAERIQELLVYVSASCPFTQSGNEKWASATSHRKNNKPYVDASRTKQTIETITQKNAVVEIVLCLGLVLNQAASTSAKPPTKNDWDVLFQLMFDEYFKPSSAVSTPISAATILPSDIAGASSSTSVDKDAPSPSTSPKNEMTSPPINSTNVEEPHNEEVIEFDSDPFTNPSAPPAQLNLTIIDNPSKPVLTRRQLDTDALWCYFHALLVKEEPQNYKEAMMESSWIEAITRGIFINQSKYALEMLKKYGLDQCDPVDIPMVERSNLDEDPSGTLVGPTRYRGMVGSLIYLTASRPDLVFAICMCARYQAKPTKKHLTAIKRVFRYLKRTINMGLWYPKDTGFDLTAFTDANHCNTKHIAFRYHFIKEQVKNEIVELYFVKNAYQLAGIFTKALTREHFEFLVKRLGMQSITPEVLKHLAESDEDKQ